MKLILRLLISAFALIGIAYLLPGVTVASFYIACVAAFILGLLNLVVRPILLVLTLPITILTLGLFSFVINAVLFWFVASFVDGFEVETFLAALIGSVLMSVVNTFTNKLL